MDFDEIDCFGPNSLMGRSRSKAWRRRETGRGTGRQLSDGETASILRCLAMPADRLKLLLLRLLLKLLLFSDLAVPWRRRVRSSQHHAPEVEATLAEIRETNSVRTQAPVSRRGSSLLLKSIEAMEMANETHFNYILYVQV